MGEDLLAIYGKGESTSRVSQWTSVWGQHPLGVYKDLQGLQGHI